MNRFSWKYILEYDVQDKKGGVIFIVVILGGNNLDQMSDMLKIQS